VSGRDLGIYLHHATDRPVCGSQALPGVASVLERAGATAGPNAIELTRN